MFVQRSRIRGIRRQSGQWDQLQRDLARQRQADAASPQHADLQRLIRQLTGTRRAIAGLSAALRQAAEGRVADLRHKRAAFAWQHQRLRRQLAAAVRASPARRSLLRTERQLQRLRVQTGLDQQEAHLAELLRDRGQRGGRAGASFEQAALEAARQAIEVDVRRQWPARAAAEPLIWLHKVTLAAARVELDHLLVRTAPDPAAAVEVLAIVEAKRNINDLAKGLQRRREDLAWFCGDTRGYEPVHYRTATFPSGHFDAPAAHLQDGRRYHFTGQSFRHLCPAAFADSTTASANSAPLPITAIPKGLYFITREGPLWGLSSTAMLRLSHRVATDLRWNLADDHYLRRLLDWCQQQANPIETPDVLRQQLNHPATADQLMIIPAG